MLPSKNIFGQDISTFKKVCVCVPFLTKEMKQLFEIQELACGFPYASVNLQNFTLIITRMGSTFVGDAVLQLERSPVEILIFLGTCGLIEKTQDLDIASVVIPRQCYVCDSFTQMLQNQILLDHISEPNQHLCDQLNKIYPNIKNVTAASVGSIYREDTFKEVFLKHSIDVLDLEFASFLSAATFIKRKAFGLLTITDLLRHQNACDINIFQHTDSILAAQKQAVNITKDVASKQISQHS